MSQEPKVTRYGVDPLVDQELATKAYVDNSSGGSGLTFARIFLSADEIRNNTTTLTDIADFVVALTANKDYIFYMQGWTTGDPTGDLKLDFTIPAGADAEHGTEFIHNAGSRGSAANTVTVNSGTTSDQELWNLWGRVRVAGTAGNIQFRLAQLTLDLVDSILEKGAMLLMWEEP